MGHKLKPLFLIFFFFLILIQSVLSEEDLILKEIEAIKNNNNLGSYETSKLTNLLINSHDKKYKDAVLGLIKQLEEKSPKKLKEYWPLYIAALVLDKNYNLVVVMQKISDLDPFDSIEFYTTLIEVRIIDQLEMIKNKKIKFKISAVSATTTSEEVDQKKFAETEQIFVDYYLSLTQTTNQSDDLPEIALIAYVSNRNKFNKLLESIILMDEPLGVLQSNLNKYTWGASCGTGSKDYSSAKKSAQALLDLEGQWPQAVIFDLINSSYWAKLNPMTENRIFQLCLEILQQQSIDYVKALTGMHLLNPNNSQLGYVSYLAPEITNKLFLNIASLDPQKYQNFEDIKSDIWKVILNSFPPKVENEEKEIIFYSRHGGSRNIENLKLTLNQTNKEQWLVLAESMSFKERHKEILESITAFFSTNKAEHKNFLQKMLQSGTFHGRFIAAGKLKAMGVKVNDQEFSPLKFKLSINSTPLVSKSINYSFESSGGSLRSGKDTDIEGVLEFQRDETFIHSGKADYLELFYNKKSENKLPSKDSLLPEVATFPGGSFFYVKVDDLTKIIDTVDLNFLAYPLKIIIDSSDISDFNPKEMYINLSYIKDNKRSYNNTEVFNQSVSYLKNFQFDELCNGIYTITIKIAGACLYENTFEIKNGANLNIKLKKGYTLKYTISLPIKSDESYKHPGLRLISPNQEISINYDYQNKKFDNLPQGEYQFSFREDTPINYDSERNLYEGYQQTFTITTDSPSVIDLGVIELKQKIAK